MEIPVTIIVYSGQDQQQVIADVFGYYIKPEEPHLQYPNRLYPCRKCGRLFHAIPPDDVRTIATTKPCSICYWNDELIQMPYDCKICEYHDILYWGKRKHSLIERVRAYTNRIKKQKGTKR